MKKIILSMVFSTICFGLFAQNNECGTPVGTVPYVFEKSKQDSINVIMAINVPYCVRVYFTVFANNDGSNRAATDADVKRQFQNMVNQYAAHNICFLLVNIKQVNNTDLNSHNTDTEEAELNPYKISECLNIFVHDVLTSNSGSLNGSAYAIPNTYLSIVSTAVASTTNLSTMGHEAGHCLGLYHTFETAFGSENVTRNPANSCYDCDVDGDLLCDTPADPNGTVDAACNFTSGGSTSCDGLSYNPMTNNVMAYGNRACRNTFTNSQGVRMRSFIIGNAAINNLIADDIVNRPSTANSSITYTLGEGQESARDLLTISNPTNSSYTVSGSAVRHFVSKKVVLKPGTTFSPASGRVRVTVSDYCN
jgi:hypothetical protein